MSKIEIISTYERTKNDELIKDSVFFEKIIAINDMDNKFLNFDESTKKYKYSGFGDLLIIPDGYYPLTSDYIDNTYISDSSNVLYKIIFYPGLQKDSEEFDNTTVISKISKQKVYLEKEYILERASFLTEEKYGYENENQLFNALENIQDGVYNSFTNKEHGRDKLKQIPPDEIIKLMKQILYKNDLINKNEYFYREADIRSLFVTYIKQKVDYYKKKNKVLDLTDLLSNIE